MWAFRQPIPGAILICLSLVSHFDCRAAGALAAAKSPIGLQTALQPGMRLRTGLCRTLENAGDGLLDLIALEPIQTLLQVSSDCQSPFSAGAIGQASPIS